MNKVYILIMLIVSTKVFAFDLDFQELNTQQRQNVGEFSIIEYPKASKETFEITYRNKPLISKSGDDIAVFHSVAKQPMVMLIDTDSDGTHDRIDYDQYDSQGRLLSTTSDRNFDGQSDFKLNVNYENGEAQASAFVWIDNKWYQVFERGRDKQGHLIKAISMNNNWIIIDISSYPFKLGK